jgi:molybdopterin synthase catalytic subunit
MTITDKPICVEDYAIGDNDNRCGGVVTFTGVVRAHNQGRPVTGIHYDCYREMADAEMRLIIEDVAAATGATTITAIHRIGELQPGDVALLVVAAAPHRKEAFDAAERTVAEIKRRVPIWKKEHYADATAEWL